MQGDNGLDQLNLIIQLCGSITPEVWPNVKNVEAYQQAQLPKDVKRHVREKLTAAFIDKRVWRNPTIEERWLKKRNLHLDRTQKRIGMLQVNKSCVYFVHFWRGPSKCKHVGK